MMMWAGKKKSFFYYRLCVCVFMGREKVGEENLVLFYIHF